MTARAFVIERCALGARVKTAIDPLDEIRDAVASLQYVPREATASIPDMLLHNRRVAKKISAALEHIDTAPVRKPDRPIPPNQTRFRRDRTSTIFSAKGRRISVVRKMPGQLEMGF